MEHYYILGADGKFFEPGRHKRNYVDEEGALYTVQTKQAHGQRIWQLCRLEKSGFRAWYQLTEGYSTEREAQAELDLCANALSLKEQENG